MPGLHTEEQIWALDEHGMKHAVTVTRAPNELSASSGTSFASIVRRPVAGTT